MSFIFVNGCYQSNLSNPGSLLKYLDNNSGTFTLHLPENFRQTTPIYFVHINKDLSSKTVQHNIIAEAGCDAVIVTSYQGRHNLPYVSETSTDIELKSNARLQYYKLQQDGNTAKHHATFTVKQARDSHLGTYHLINGAAHTQDYFSYHLNDLGASCDSIGFYQTHQKQRVEINSRIRHASSNTNSQQLYKGIANDQSYAKFNGMIIVNPDLQKISAHQRNNNLLLSAQARVDTQPALEIYSEDIHCTHGATIGQLDEEALFYLKSRGIQDAAAHALLSTAFSNEVFHLFPDHAMAKMMQDTL